MLLNTKIQYKNFEPGEFVDIKSRTYEETITCINNFPWESERDHIQISLTNPSLTIESDINNFLKFAVFYNGKFVLHFFNTDQELYTKSFYHKEEAFPYIKNLFESEVFDLHDFKKEPTWLQHNLIHFVTQDFHYTITRKRCINYLLNTSGVNLLLSVIFFIGILLTKNHLSQPLPAYAMIVFLLVLWGGGLNLFTFWNYYRYAKDKMLYMTKGDDTFYFGDTSNPTKYNKNDIRQVVIYQPRGSRNPLSMFAVVEIEFRGSETIQIPNLFVNVSALRNKLYKCPIVQKGKWKLVWKDK